MDLDSTSQTEATKNKLTFADCFAGIGGMHLGLAPYFECAWACEIDPAARKTYEGYFKAKNPELFDPKSSKFFTDITTLDYDNLPDFDVLVGGFPCQAFSVAGKRLGFEETRGTLFFNLASILKAKKPKAFLFENVKGLLSHDKGKTLKTIQATLEELGYSHFHKVLNAKDYGLPQGRERLFIIGFRKDLNIDSFDFPEKKPLTLTMSGVFEAPCDRDVGYTLRVGGQRSGINDRHNWDCYWVNGQAVFLTPKEALKMQGFPVNFTFPHSDRIALRQLGNSVAVTVIEALGAAIQEKLVKKIG